MKCGKLERPERVVIGPKRKFLEVEATTVCLCNPLYEGRKDPLYDPETYRRGHSRSLLKWSWVVYITILAGFMPLQLIV